VRPSATERAPGADAGPLRLGGALALAFWLSSDAALAQTAQGFNFCAPPFPPSCVEKAVSRKAIAACDKEVQNYIASVFHYRECLEAQTERAVFQSNQLLNAWKCKQNKEDCRRRGLSPPEGAR